MFPDTSLVESFYFSQTNEAQVSLEKMIQVAIDKKFPHDRLSELKKIEYDHVNIFGLHFRCEPRKTLLLSGLTYSRTQILLLFAFTITTRRSAKFYPTW